MGSTWVSVKNFSDTPVLVRSAPCVLESARYVNGDVAARFCQIFDAASLDEVTLGTTEPDFVLAAGANGQDDSMKQKVAFTRGVVVAGTTTATGNTGADAATQTLRLALL